MKSGWECQLHSLQGPCGSAIAVAVLRRSKSVVVLLRMPGGAKSPKFIKLNKNGPFDTGLLTKKLK